MSSRFSFVRFRHHDLLCLEQDDQMLVAMRPVVEGMGLDWKSQHAKLSANFDRWRVVIITTRQPGDDRVREHLFIPLERLFGWLMTISPNKVAPAIRATVIAYQQECDRVLARHFAHELTADAAWYRDHAATLRAGWYARYPLWLDLRTGAALGESRAQMARDLGRHPSTIGRNLRRMRAVGLLTTPETPRRRAAGPVRG
ncbi:MAG: hypothetical protein IPN92_07075 [Chromatiaceae bacterium]|nr:hypothetical protein [Chromatiaceae bacterium]